MALCKCTTHIKCPSWLPSKVTEGTVTCYGINLAQPAAALLPALLVASTTACVCHSPISLSLVQWHLTEADTQTVKKLTFGLGMQCYNCHCSCTCGSFRTEMLPCSRSSQGCHALQSCQAYVFAKIWRGAGDRFNRLHLTLGSSGDYACLLEGNCDFIIKHLLAVAAVCIQSMCKTVIDTAFSGSNVSSYAL